MTLVLQSCYDLICQNLPISEIAQREGMNEQSCRRLVSRLVGEHGINYVPNLDKDMPYGLTNESLSQRIDLANKLYDLRQLHTRFEVSKITGLNLREQRRAERRPYTHDWKISQIERLNLWWNNQVKT